MSTSALTQSQLTKIEDQITAERKLVDYITLEYPIEVIVNKYLEGEEDDENEIFIPQYQRNFVWSDERQSKFIESLFLGLPIPFLFLAEVTGENEGRVEIVDGSQRIRTLSNYINNGLKLSKLKKLTELNGTFFDNLPKARKMRFLRTNIKLVLLTEKADEVVRQDLFERINTGSDLLNAMEVRTGALTGPFSDFVKNMSENSLLSKLAPIGKILSQRREYEELTLRFFAYLDDADHFQHRVDSFIDQYLIKMNKSGFNQAKYEKTFIDMLSFVEKTIPNGFKKLPNSKATPRVRFETIAVGAAKALEKNPTLICSDISWLDSDEFKEHTRSDGSNSKVKLKARIEYSMNKFLGD